MVKLILGLIALSFVSFAQVDEQIFKAMQDELSRSMSSLKLDGLERPYYIEYRVEISNVRAIESTMGGVVDDTKSRRANLDVKVRIGDYQFDNTNFFDIGLGFFGSSDDEEVYQNRNIAIKPDYNTVRRELWLATDAAYKREAEIYSKKVATLQNKIRRDSTPDFLQVKAEENINYQEIPNFDGTYFTDLVNACSGIFNNYSTIQTSTAIVEYEVKEVYYLNSEGMKFYNNDYNTNLEVVATTQSEDGMPLGNYYRTMSKDPNSFEKKENILEKVKHLADVIDKQTKIDAELDDYSGPILFEGNAATQIFAQQFAPNLVTQRKPLSEGGFSTGNDFDAFQTKIGGRVLPEFLSLSAIPNQEKYNGLELSGHFKFDDEGLKAKDFTIVEDGFLKELFSSRIPTKRVKASNGHKRSGGTMFSTIMMTSNEEKALSYDSLKSRMIELCKMRELPYGIIVRNIMDRNVMFTSLYRQNPGLFQFNNDAGSFMITEAYKVYPDGREELIRGLDGKGFTARSFKDILNVSKNNNVMNFLASAVISPFISGGDRFIHSTMIIPNLLFEDGELVAPQGNFDKPPFLKNPISVKNGK